MGSESDKIAVFCDAVAIDSPWETDKSFVDAETNIQKLNVCRMQCQAGQMMVFPSENMEITQKDILPFSKIADVTE